MVLQLRGQRRLRYIDERVPVDLLEVPIARYLEEDVELRQETAHDMPNASLTCAVESGQKCCSADAKRGGEVAPLIDIP